MDTVGVVGFGYIGAVIGACLADRGCNVTGIDVDGRTVELTNRGETELFEPDLARLIREHHETGRLQATTDFSILSRLDTIVVTVGTPLDSDLKPDLGYLRAAADSIAPHLRSGHTVILKSTVVPRVTRDLFAARLSARTGLTAGKDFFIAFSPERIAEGRAIREFLSLPVVVGADDPNSLERVAGFWRDMLGVQVIKVSSTIGAELTKLADNLWIDTNIALANQIAKLCHAHGADFEEVQLAANSLPKGQRHVNILQSSIGVGGSCLTKDPLFCAGLLADSGYDNKLILEARSVNDGMPAYTADVIGSWLGKQGPQNPKVAIMGLAFKSDTNDLRYTPVRDLITELSVRGIPYLLSDPHVSQDHARRVFGSDAPISDFESAVDGANVLCFACGHAVYREQDLASLRLRTASPCLFVDGRHAFSRQNVTAAGFEYVAI